VTGPGHGEFPADTTITAKRGRPPQLQLLLLYVTVLLALFGVLFSFAGMARFSFVLFAAAGCTLLALISGMKDLLRWFFPGSDAPEMDPDEKRRQARRGHGGHGRQVRREQGGQVRPQQGGSQHSRPPWEPGAPPTPINPARTGPIGPGRHTGPLVSAPLAPAPPQGPAALAGRGPATGVVDRPEVRGTVPDPPMFGTSTAGQAPWRLPAHAAPSGLAADAANLGDLEVRAASMVGPSHRCDEPADPRQDAYALGRTTDGQYLIVAVADGVGSSRNSDLGARVAVTTSVRELAKMLARGGIPAIDTQLLYNLIVGAMVGTGRDRNLPDGDICSIVITAVIPTAPGPDGTRKLWASWIGDVSMWIVHGGVLERLTGEEKSGLDRNQLSAVLPFHPDQYQEDTYNLPPDSRVALMTDGLSDAFSDVAHVADFFAAQWAGPPPHPAAFLHSLCYDAPGQGDDRTAVVVWTGTDRRSRRERPQ
jgi:serine/threonine protein phosphatase PrpC